MEVHNGVVNVNGGRISKDTTSRAHHPRTVNLSWTARLACLTSLHVGALSSEGVSQNVFLTAFRRQTRAQAKQFASGDLLFSLGVRVGHFDFAKRAQFLVY